MKTSRTKAAAQETVSLDASPSSDTTRLILENLQQDIAQTSEEIRARIEYAHIEAGEEDIAQVQLDTEHAEAMQVKQRLETLLAQKSQIKHDHQTRIERKKRSTPYRYAVPRGLGYFFSVGLYAAGLIYFLLRYRSKFSEPIVDDLTCAGFFEQQHQTGQTDCPDCNYYTNDPRVGDGQFSKEQCNGLAQDTAATTNSSSVAELLSACAALCLSGGIEDTDWGVFASALILATMCCCLSCSYTKRRCQKGDPITRLEIKKQTELDQIDDELVNLAKEAKWLPTEAERERTVQPDFV